MLCWFSSDGARSGFSYELGFALDLMNPMTVHEALKQCRERGPLFVEIDGLLSFEFERICLSHWPKAEQAEEIWIETEGVFAFDERVLSRWSGKRVIVFGELESAPPPPGFEGEWGFGHMGMFPAQIKARRIERWKDRVRARRLGEG